VSEASEFFPPPTHKVNITVNEKGLGSVKLDGRELNTTYVKVESVAGHPPTVTIAVLADVQVAAAVPTVALDLRTLEALEATLPEGAP